MDTLIPAVAAIAVVAIIGAATACTAITFGVCGAVILGGALAAGAVSGAVTYALQPGPKSWSGFGQSVGFGAIGGLFGGVLGAVGSKIIAAVAPRVLAAASGLVSRASGSIASDSAALGTSDAAASAVSAIKLGRQLASEQQLGEVGTGGKAILGAGTDKPLNDAPDLADQYGGTPDDWAKMSSSKYMGPDGYRFETHWYQNTQTGETFEPKVKLLGFGSVK